MLVLLIFLLFIAAFLTASLAVGAASILVGPRWFEAPGRRGRLALPAETPLLLRQQPLSTISVWRQLLARFDFVKILGTAPGRGGIEMVGGQNDIDDHAAGLGGRRRCCLRSTGRRC